MMQERWVQWAVGTICLIMQAFTHFYTMSSSSKLSGCLCNLCRAVLDQHTAAPPRGLTPLPAVFQDLPGSVSERIMKEAAAQQDELRAEALAASGGLGEVHCHPITVVSCML